MCWGDEEGFGMRTVWSSSMVVVARRDQHSNAAAIEGGRGEGWLWRCDKKGHVLVLTLWESFLQLLFSFHVFSSVKEVPKQVLFSA